MTTDKHVSRKMVRLDDDVHGMVARLAARNDRTVTREVRRIITEALAAAGLWPPGGGEAVPRGRGRPQAMERAASAPVDGVTGMAKIESVMASPVPIVKGESEVVRRLRERQEAVKEEARIRRREEKARASDAPVPMRAVEELERLADKVEADDPSAVRVVRDEFAPTVNVDG